MASNLKLSQAVEGLLFYKTATGKSPCTLADYRTGFKKLLLYFDADPLIASITHDQLVAFFAWLQDEYISEPDGVAPRGQIRLSPKSIKNIHTALSALWTWAVNEGYVEKNIVHTIAPPRLGGGPLRRFGNISLLGSKLREMTTPFLL